MLFHVDYYNFDVWDHLPVASFWVEADTKNEAEEKAEKQRAAVEAELGTPVYFYVGGSN